MFHGVTWGISDNASPAPRHTFSTWDWIWSGPFPTLFRHLPPTLGPPSPDRGPVGKALCQEGREPGDLEIGSHAGPAADTLRSLGKNSSSLALSFPASSVTV